VLIGTRHGVTENDYVRRRVQCSHRRVPNPSELTTECFSPRRRLHTRLLITGPAAFPVRAMDDVDVIVEMASYAEYSRFSKRRRKLGFSEDSSEGAPICRWLIDHMKLDVMPTDQTILGFSNRWCKLAIKAAEVVTLNGFELRVVTTPYFIGTKLEAFRGIGKGDFYRVATSRTS